MIEIQCGSDVPWGTPPKEADELAAANPATPDNPFSVRIIPNEGSPYVVHYVASAKADMKGWKSVGIMY